MWTTFLVIIVTAATTFFFNFLFKKRSEHRARQALAAALAGELEAYLRLLRPQETFSNFRTVATACYEARVAALQAMCPLPSGHPVFDRVANKIGILPPDAARGVSEAYNIITSGRLLLTHISSDAFLKAADHVQTAVITASLNMLEPEIQNISTTVRLLEQIAQAKPTPLDKILSLTLLNKLRATFQ